MCGVHQRGSHHDDFSLCSIANDVYASCHSGWQTGLLAILAFPWGQRRSEFVGQFQGFEFNPLCQDFERNPAPIASLPVHKNVLKRSGQVLVDLHARSIATPVLASKSPVHVLATSACLVWQKREIGWFSFGRRDCDKGAL